MIIQKGCAYSHIYCFTIDHRTASNGLQHRPKHVAQSRTKKPTWKSRHLPFVHQRLSDRPRPSILTSLVNQPIITGDGSFSRQVATFIRLGPSRLVPVVRSQIKDDVTATQLRQNFRHKVEELVDVVKLIFVNAASQVNPSLQSRGRSRRENRLEQ